MTEQKNPFVQGQIGSEECTNSPSNHDAHEEQEGMMLPVEYFLEQHYLFRRNVLSGMVEYKKTDESDSQFIRLTSEELNTIIIMAKREMQDVPDLKTDINPTFPI